MNPNFSRSSTRTCFRCAFQMAIRVVALSLDYSSLFARRNTDATNLTPDLEISACCVFDFCCFHGSSRFPLDWGTAFESAKQLPSCNPPCVCNCRPCTSGRVSTQLPVAVLRRCDPVQTISADDTGGSERRDTSVHRFWPRSGSQCLFALWRRCGRLLLTGI